MSLSDIITAAVAVGTVTWIATPTLQRSSQMLTKSPVQIAASEQSVYYANCSEARAAGAAPIHRGSPGYRPELDGDDDGIACEPYR